MNSSESLCGDEILRYARHLILPEVGKSGQERLKASSVLLVGAGGLGSPAAMYLASAGVGRLGIVDFDNVDESNLQRQIMHGTTDVGRPKIQSAMETLSDINPWIKLEPHGTALNKDNAMSICSDYDVVVDGTDNFATRYLVNDVCVLLGKPNCYGSIFRFEGQASVFAYEGGPCYRCLYPEPPAPGVVPSCAEGGVLGVLPGIIGVIQATEAIKLLLRFGDSLSGRLMLFDALAMKFREMKVKRDPKCPVCGDNPTITAPIDYEQFCGAAPNSDNDEAQSPWDIEPEELNRRFDQNEEFLLLDVREPHEYEICNLRGRLIPLGELETRHAELDKQVAIIVHCKMGGRSAKAVKLLRERGFADVSNLKGGIHAWADRIDPSMPKY